MQGAALLALAAMGATALGQQPPAGGPPAGGPPRGGGGGGGLAPLLIESKAFADGAIVPAKYSARGGNVQPDFTISNAPATTQSFAIIMHDISVSLNKGTDDVTHWLAWNIPGDTKQIEEGKLPAGSVQGANLMRQNAYMGMGAPAGPRYHHYVFEFYALDAKLDLPPTATRAELLAAMNGKVVAKSAYVGRFRSEPGAAGPPGAGPGAPGTGAGGPPRGPGGPGGPPGGPAPGGF
jgi:Raf kinase inhibitor-like YbhB/YbcL family protein